MRRPKYLYWVDRLGLIKITPHNNKKITWIAKVNNDSDYFSKTKSQVNYYYVGWSINLINAFKRLKMMWTINLPLETQTVVH